MELKEFFKPTIAKIALFLALMAIPNYLLISTSGVEDARILVGLPLGFWPIGSFFATAGAPAPPTVEFSWINFGINAVFWYFLSCAAFAAYPRKS